MNNRFFYGLLLGNFFFVFGSERELQVYSVSMDEYDQIVFSKNPNVPATRELISHALKKNDFNEAAFYATRATFNNARDLVDPYSALTLSGLLLYKEKIPVFQHLSLRNKAELAGRLLDYAAMPRNLATDEKRILQYQNAQAQEQLQRFREIFPSLSHEIYEEEMNQLGEDQLQHRVSFEVLRDRALPAACFFAKRSLSAYREWNNERKQFCISPDAQHALYWITFVLGDPNGPQLLQESGVAAALDAVSQNSADEDLKNNIALVLTKINEGRSASAYEQETARQNLLGLCASTDLRAMLLLAQENDPKLFYGSQLVSSLAKASEQDYPELLKGSLQLLARRIPEPDSNFALINVAKLDTPQALVMRILQSDHFQQAKQKFSNANFMVEIGEILHEIGKIELIGASPEQIENSKKIRQCGKDLIYKARDKGNVRAQWKVLSMQDPNAQTAKNLEDACQSTLKTIQQPDQTLSLVIDQALEHIENYQMKHPDRKLYASLGSVYINGIGKLKTPDHAKAVSYLTAAGTDGIEALLSAAESITCPETCLYAATQLYHYYDVIDQEKFSSAITKYLHYAKLGNRAVIKETLRLLKTAQDAKADNQIAQTLRQFLDELGDDAREWQNESAFVNEIIDFCMDRAQTRLASKTLVAQILKNYAPYIKHPGIQNPAERAKEILYECAVVNRDAGSILFLLPEFDSVEQSLPAITKAARIWHACSQVFSAVPVKRDEATKKMKELVMQYDQILKASHEIRTDLTFDYYACMVLAETDPREATRLLHRVEEEVQNNALIIPSHNQGLIETTGFQKFIENYAAQAKGWGFFAQAILKFFREPTNPLKPQLMISNLEEIDLLLKRAREAYQPYADPNIFTPAIMHYWQGLAYNNKAELSEKNDTESQIAREISICHLDNAARLGHVIAGVEWAYQVLHNKTEEIKSDTLERAIDRLIQGLEYNNDIALTQLNKMQSYGLVQGWACGGRMTPALLGRIENELVSWSINRLQNKSDRSGQNFFEKIIDQLIKGVTYNNAQSREQLEIMQARGLPQAWACGGAMNESLLAKINAVLENSTKPVVVAAASSSQSSEACSQSSQASIIHATDAAIAFFEEKKYQDAFKLFTSALEQNLPSPLRAATCAYLGIIHEQGLTGAPDKTRAIDFYKRALLAWDGSVSKYGTAFTPAVRLLIDQVETDLESAHALLNYALHSAYQQSTDERMTIVFEALKNMESFAAQSATPEDRNLLFNSGISRRLAGFYNKYHNMPFLLALISQYARRICAIGIPDPKTEQQNLAELMVPLDQLQELF